MTNTETQQITQHDPTARHEQDDETPGRRRDLASPVQAAKQPDTRAKLLLAVTVMSVLNLVLLLILLAGAGAGGHEEVIVDGEPCLIAEHDGDNVLYCAR